MPASLRLRVGAVASSLLALSATASAAHAAPTPTPSASTLPQPTADPCAAFSGLARQYCDLGDGAATGGTPGSGMSNDPTDALNPLTSLARGCADAAAWIVGELSKAVNGTANVDFTNGTFLKQYAIVFAASTILTLVLWLFAVAKRAIRGVPFTTAMYDWFGFLC
ncbi:hypothetical protein ACFWAX_38170, partial [Streptomyces sp. NPDC059956]